MPRYSVFKASPTPFRTLNSIRTTPQPADNPPPNHSRALGIIRQPGKKNDTTPGESPFDNKVMPPNSWSGMNMFTKLFPHEVEPKSNKKRVMASKLLSFIVTTPK